MILLNKIRKLIGSKICMAICVVIAIVSLVVIINDDIQKKRAQEKVDKLAQEAVTEKGSGEEAEVYMNFESLHEINSDIYAWVFVPNTNINYPVLQSPQGQDTDYYLNTNLDGSSGYPGCIYTQLRNSKDFTDPVTIIYGHNMKNGTMFANLHQYREQEFFQQNPYVYIFGEKQNMVYKVFSCAVFDDKLILDYYNDFENEKDMSLFMEEVKNQSENYDDSIEINLNKDKIIGLSTCMANSPNERLYVFAKKLTDDEVNNLNLNKQLKEIIKYIGLHEN